jgi:chemotaxis protein methyltransferase CheR
MMLPRSQAISVPPGIAALLRDLVHEKTGLFFEDARFDMLIDKLRDRAAARGCRSFLDYYYILKYDNELNDEWLRVMDAFSVQETYFFREYAQIEALLETIIPQWFARTIQPLKIWSAACASGEEPYSLAIALKERGWDRYPIEIIASDASELALSRAHAAVYRERSFRSFPLDLRQKYFTPVEEGSQLRKDLILPVRFKRINLASPEDIAQVGQVQVIFCRNVFIYFSPTAIQRTVSAFALQMLPGNQLFIGASESLLKLSSEFELHEMRDAFVYTRTALAPTLPS